MNHRESWVFLRGLARESRHWGRFVNDFKRRFPLADVHLLDLPGTGQRAQEKSPSTISEITDALRQTLVKKHAPANLRLLSISLGSMVALDWIARYPEDCSACVVINTSTRHTGSPLDRFNLFSGLKLVGAFLGKDVRKREQSILSVVSNRRETRRENLEAWVQYAKERPMDWKNILRQLQAASLFGLPATRPETPVLVLRSAKDRLVHPACSERLAQWWDFSMKTHPTAGHDLSLDDPEWVASQVYEWTVNLET